jgi:hypothetical protein
MLLLPYIFIRHSLGTADQTPESAKKLSQLRASFRRATGRRAV